jgi:GH18 family chitinase
MAYDMVGPEGGHHAKLENVQRAVEFLLQDGVGLEKIPHKIILGIPAYARNVRAPSQVKTFSEIYDAIIQENSDILDIDRMHSWNGYEWDSPARIHDKIDLAKKMGLGGIFFWEAGQDKFTDDHPRGILLESAASYQELVEGSQKEEL